MEELKAPEYQEEMNELLRMKKQLLGAQGCSCQSQQKNDWRAHCLKVGIYALAQFRRAKPENKVLTCEGCIGMEKQPRNREYWACLICTRNPNMKDYYARKSDLECVSKLEDAATENRKEVEQCERPYYPFYNPSSYPQSTTNHQSAQNE